MTLNDEGRDRMIDGAAHDTWNYMKNEVRVQAKRDPETQRTFTVDELCMNGGYTRYYWPEVRDRMARKGYPLAYKHMTGYYVGEQGEGATLAIHRWLVARGVMRSLRKTVVNMAQAPNFNPTDINNMLMEHGHTLHTFMLVCESFKLPALPEPIQAALLEDGGLDEAG